MEKTKNEKKERKKQAKKKKEIVYEYTPLLKAIAKPTKDLNVYGIIIDSLLPYKIPNGSFLCVLRVIDPSLTSQEDKREPLQISIFAPKRELMPLVQKVGCIFRAHRGRTHVYREQMQYTVDMKKGGAWILFDLSDEDVPIAESGKTHSFSSEDAEILKQLRKFGREYFGKIDIGSKGRLANAEKARLINFNCICLLLSIKRTIFAGNNFLILKLCDKTKKVKMKVPEDRFNYLKSLSVICIRNVGFFNEYRELRTSETTNMLLVPSEFLTYKIHVEEVQTAQKDIRLLYDIHWTRTNELLMAGNILNDHSIDKYTQLKDIERAEDKEKLHKIKIKVVTIFPSNPAEWIWGRNVETNECVPQGQVKDGNYEYYWKLQFIVQDISSNDPDLYRIYLWSLQGKGKEFFNSKLCAKVDSKAKDQRSEYPFYTLKDISKFLVQPWIALDMVVEIQRLPPNAHILLIVDTQVSIP